MPLSVEWGKETSWESVFKYNLACQARVLLGWGCLNGNQGTCRETARSKTSPATVWALLPAPGPGATRKEPQRGEGSSWDSWGSPTAGVGAGRCQLQGLAFPETNTPSCFSSAATHHQWASLPVHVHRSKISHLQSFSPYWAPRSALGRLPPERETYPLAGMGMGAVPEHPPPLYILLCTQPAHSNLTMLTLKKNHSKKNTSLNSSDLGDFKMPPHCCTDLPSVAEVFSTVIHFPLALNLVAPAPCITLKICPYVSSKIYQLGLLTQSNVYCFQRCRANVAKQQAISTSCSIIKIAS